MTDKKLSALSTGAAIASADLFYSAQGGGQVKQPASAFPTYFVSSGLMRQNLTNTFHLYIDPTGNDVTGDGSIGNPWRQIQRAFDYIVGTIDMAGFGVFINMAPGTYDSASLVGPIAANSTSGLALIANGAVTISGAASFTLLYTYFSFLYVGGTGPYTFTNTTAGGNVCLFADQNSLIVIDPSLTINFTGCATDIIHFLANRNGYLEIRGGTIATTGNFGVQFYAVNNAGIDVGNIAATTLTYSSSTAATAWTVADLSSVVVFESGLATSGTLTGPKYLVKLNSVLQTFAQTLPGTAGGTASSGGQFS